MRLRRGHAVDFDDDGNVVGVIIVNLKFLIDRDGELRITWADGHVSHDDGAVGLATAA